jgi:hypothetical protein
VAYRHPDEERLKEHELDEERVRAADLATIAAMKRLAPCFRYLKALVIFIVVTAVATPAIYALAILVAPARTADGHPVMPIGQVGIAMVLGPILGIGGGALFGRR